MKATITNTSKGPRGIRPDGVLRYLEAGASFTGEFDEGDIASLRRRGDVEVIFSPLDHDHDGNPGGSVDELDQMKAADLKALAKAENVDLQDATRKDDIIAAIRLDREAKAAGE